MSFRWPSGRVRRASRGRAAPRTNASTASALSAPVARKTTVSDALSMRERDRHAVDVRARHGGRSPAELVQRRIVREERRRVPVRADPEQREVEDDASQLLVVRVRASLRGELAEHAVLDRRLALEAVEEALADEPVVRALVVRRHAALVGQPDLDAAPVRLEPAPRARTPAPASMPPESAMCPPRRAASASSSAAPRGRPRRARRDPKLDVHLLLAGGELARRGPSRPGSRSGTPRGRPPARARGSRGSSSRPGR